MSQLSNSLIGKSYLCAILGHRFLTTKRVNSHFNEYQCSVCRQQATNDSNGQKIIMTSQLKEINETLFYLHQKRAFVTKFYFLKKT